MREEGEEMLEGQAAEDLSGIRECFHPVVREYGRTMFAFVYNAGMVQQAVGQIVQIAGGHPQVMAAGRVLGDCFNVMGGQLGAAYGWTGERLGECEAAILRAATGQLVVVKH